MNRDNKGRLVGVPFHERLQIRLDEADRTESGCWIWKGHLTGSGGYPSIRNADNKATRVGRAVLEYVGKPSPSDKHLACHT